MDFVGRVWDLVRYAEWHNEECAKECDEADTKLEAESKLDSKLESRFDFVLDFRLDSKLDSVWDSMFSRGAKSLSPLNFPPIIRRCFGIFITGMWRDFCDFLDECDWDFCKICDERDWFDFCDFWCFFVIFFKAECFLWLERVLCRVVLGVVLCVLCVILYVVFELEDFIEFLVKFIERAFYKRAYLLIYKNILLGESL